MIYRRNEIVVLMSYLDKGGADLWRHLIDRSTQIAEIRLHQSGSSAGAAVGSFAAKRRGEPS
jgi:hypothetical protein